MPKDRIVCLLVAAALLAGCTRPATVPVTAELPTLTRAVDTAIPPTSVPEPQLETPLPVALCSPLSDISLSELKDYVSNPFSPAPIPEARDGGHPGTDFAYYTHPVTGRVMLGSSLYALLPGRVASVSSGKAPFGNLVMVETPLDNLPADIAGLFMAYPQPTPSAPETHLNCPASVDYDPAWQPDQPSLYVLYAHMDQPAEFNIGDAIACGDAIGLVGNTGRSGNPHLHLEIRYGPGSTSFGNLAHYSNNATPEEMAAYCTWRVSGIFQAIDPMLLIDLAD
jgi:murein DD-endopeptidase MepM/ murein hydrolase activator NlpD